MATRSRSRFPFARRLATLGRDVHRLEHEPVDSTVSGSWVHRSNLMKTRLVLVGLALLLALGGAAFYALRPKETDHAPAEMYAARPPAPGPLPKLWKAPELAYPDQRSEIVTSTQLRGEPWIADFIFTQCTSACPMMTARMVMVQRALAGVPVRFVSFSVDPAHDTPDAMAAYAKTWNPTETRWKLLSTTGPALAKTIAGFRVTARPTTDPNNAIIHSTLFLLVDADGFVRGVYDSESEEARTRLVADARSLTAPAPPSATEAESSLAAFGCAGCHDKPQIAPTLGGLFGSEVVLEDGSTVVADDAYVRRAIEEPASQAVRGYPLIMPSYRLSAAQIDGLVREIKAAPRATSSAGVAKPAPVAVVIDPVCGMKVRAAPESLHVKHGEREVYFCSEGCKESFVANPGSFAEDAGHAYAMPGASH